ncbi:MAG: Nramp family divalent metal transporter [Planctomycetota bacterium]
MANSNDFQAPHPGSKSMPQWTTGELIEAPFFAARNWRAWLAMIGPGLVMGAAAIGGGEWLSGPVVSAKYGGALLWVAAFSILIQVLYNIEICRYTLYCGEPIFTGKFRMLPGPMFWLFFYLLLDWGSVFPYLIVNAATTLEELFITDFQPDKTHWVLHRVVSSMLYFAVAVPLVFGGKIYNSLKVVMSLKLIIVFGFLLTVGLFFSKPSHWVEIASGFFKVGNLPVEKGEDLNGNGVLDPGEDYDFDGQLDVVEKKLTKTVDTDGDGQPDAWEKDAQGKDITFEDLDGDGKRDGANVENLFQTLFQEGRFPAVDLSLIAMIAGLAAIAGNGGLTNTPISNFTRDQGWGMGHHVGAIPSMVGGTGISLSHEGCVFEVNEESLPRWKRWYQHIVRDQVFVWMGACFIGVALPSILSVGFLPRGTDVANSKIATVTSTGVVSIIQDPPEGVLAHHPAVKPWMSGEKLANAFRAGTLLCGFLVLITSMISTMDGFIRRWVDVFWTASAKLRELDVSYIKYVYFVVLMAYISGGLIVIWTPIDARKVFELATTGYNFALAFSCWHTLAINSTLLPRPLRPHLLIRVGLVLGGLFFTFLGTMAVLKLVGVIR